MEIVEIDAAAPQLDALIDRVLAGELIYLARNGRVLVHLEPLGVAPRRRQAVSDPPEDELAASAETFRHDGQLTEEEEALLNDIKQATWKRVRHLFEFPDRSHPRPGPS